MQRCSCMRLWGHPVPPLTPPPAGRPPATCPGSYVGEVWAVGSAESQVMTDKLQSLTVTGDTFAE